MLDDNWFTAEIEAESIVCNIWECYPNFGYVLIPHWNKPRQAAGPTLWLQFLERENKGPSQKSNNLLWTQKCMPAKMAGHHGPEHAVEHTKA